eukprot:12401295-Karenia_brevis.AAC.1
MCIRDRHDYSLTFAATTEDVCSQPHTHWQKPGRGRRQAQMELAEKRPSRDILKVTHYTSRPTSQMLGLPFWGFGIPDTLYSYPSPWCSPGPLGPIVPRGPTPDRKTVCWLCLKPNRSQLQQAAAAADLNRQLHRLKDIHCYAHAHTWHQ